MDRDPHNEEPKRILEAWLQTPPEAAAGPQALYLHGRSSSARSLCICRRIHSGSFSACNNEVGCPRDGQLQTGSQQQAACKGWSLLASHPKPQGYGEIWSWSGWEMPHSRKESSGLAAGTPFLLELHPCGAEERGKGPKIKGKRGKELQESVLAEMFRVR